MGVAGQAGSAADKLTGAVTTFASRAIRGRQLAYALIAEPVDPRVEQERLRYRYAYAEVFEDIIQMGIEQKDFVQQDSHLSAAAIVGMLAESLVGPLSPSEAGDNSFIESSDEIIENLVALVLRTVGFQNI